MSRSKKKKPFYNVANGTKRSWFKRMTNKIKRQLIRQKIKHENYDEIENKNDPWNWWNDPADGKARIKNKDREKEWAKKIMRK